MHLSFLLPIIFTELVLSSSSTKVHLLGLFPENQNLTTLQWIQQALAMFKAAVQLANRYGMTVNNQPVGYVTLETRTHGDGLTAFNQVCRQMTNSNIVGIVGPAASSEARFVSPFTTLLNIPMVSYAATSPDIATATFFRLTPSDTVLAMAVVELFIQFSWSSCIMIVQADEYGYGGMKLISEDYHLNITDRLIFDMHKQKFQIDVKETLIWSRSRIVLVWANEDVTTVIVRKIMQVGLFDSEFVWIFTSRVALEKFTLNETKKLLGILSVEPIVEPGLTVNKTLLHDSYALWKELEPMTFPGASNVSNYALQTFDAAWMLLLALHNASSTPSLLNNTSYCFDARLTQTDEYFYQLKTSKFLGVSGEVFFSQNGTNDRVHSAYYVLFNLQAGNRKELNYVPVLEWCERIGAEWVNYTRESKAPTAIIWPTGTSTVPVDHPVIKGKVLRIGLIEAPPFIIAVNSCNISNVPSTAICTEDRQHLLTGFIPELIRLLQETMGFESCLHLVSDQTGYNALVESVGNGTYDMGIGSLTITSNRLRLVDFSTPFHETTIRLVVRYSATPPVFDPFSYLRPFSRSVWLTLLAVVLYSGVLIYVFERNNSANLESRSWYSAFGMSICYALSTVVGMGGDFPLATGAARMLAIAQFTLYVILIATYTANLSSFLTLQRSQPSITSIDDVKNQRVPDNKIGVLQNSSYVDFYVQNISSKYYPVRSLSELCNRLLNKTIDAGLYDSTRLEYIISQQYCGQLTAVGVGFARSPYGIAVPKGWLHKTELDRVLLSLHETGTIANLEKTWLQAKVCKDGQSTVNEDGAAISIDVLGGLFMTFLIASLIAIILHVWCRRRQIKTKASVLWNMIREYVQKLR